MLMPIRRMIPLCRNSLILFQNVNVVAETSLLGTRYASLTSAIGRAARKSAAVESWKEKRHGRSSGNIKPKPLERNGKSVAFPHHLQTPELRPGNKWKGKREIEEKEVRYWGRRELAPKYERDPYEKRVSSDTRATSKGHFNKPRVRGRHHHPTDETPERVKENVLVPASIPYTTSASEFIYGLSAVEAALRCTRRKVYVLYIYQAVDENLSPEKILLRKLALARSIKVKMAFAGWDRLLDKMSGGRPHNGCVLEASPLPQIPASYLEAVPQPAEDYFRVSLSSQSIEEAAVNGSDNQLARVPRYDESSKSRFPLVLLLDGILDPGNLGAIIRSAYYLGVDAIVLTGRNSAPMTPVTIKASAGAAENMTILKAKNAIDFISRSRENGWRFYAADSPSNLADITTQDNTLAEDTTLGSAAGILHSAPTVLMLGSEATGLSNRIKAQADGFVSIPGARIQPQSGIKDAAQVDSLNVSVAAALLIEMLMHVPLQVATFSNPSKPTTEIPPKSFDFN